MDVQKCSHIPGEFRCYIPLRAFPALPLRHSFGRNASGYANDNASCHLSFPTRRRETYSGWSGCGVGPSYIPRQPWLGIARFGADSPPSPTGVSGWTFVRGVLRRDDRSDPLSDNTCWVNIHSRFHHHHHQQHHHQHHRAVSCNRT